MPLKRPPKSKLHRIKMARKRKSNRRKPNLKALNRKKARRLLRKKKGHPKSRKKSLKRPKRRGRGTSIYHTLSLITRREAQYLSTK